MISVFCTNCLLSLAKIARLRFFSFSTRNQKYVSICDKAPMKYRVTFLSHIQACAGQNARKFVCPTPNLLPDQQRVTKREAVARDKCELEMKYHHYQDQVNPACLQLQWVVNYFVSESLARKNSCIFWNLSLFQTSNVRTREHINPEEAEVFVEFLLDGVLPKEEKVYPLAILAEPLVHESNEKVDFHTNPLCTNEYIHMKVCDIVLIPFHSAIFSLVSEQSVCISSLNLGCKSQQGFLILWFQHICWWWILYWSKGNRQLHNMQASSKCTKTHNCQSEQNLA